MRHAISAPIAATTAAHRKPVWNARSAVWEADIHAFVCDWLRERFAGKPVKHPGKVLYLETSGAGPNAASVATKRRWFD